MKPTLNCAESYPDAYERSRRHRFMRDLLNRALTTALAFFLVPGDGLLAGTAQSQPQNTPSTAGSTSKVFADQLDSLVALIALYPDPLLAQTLEAATYPLEIIQLQQWLAKNPGLKDKALFDAVAKQPWDPRVQAFNRREDIYREPRWNSFRKRPWACDPE